MDFGHTNCLRGDSLGTQYPDYQGHCGHSRVNMHQSCDGIMSYGHCDIGLMECSSSIQAVYLYSQNNLSTVLYPVTCNQISLYLDNIHMYMQCV